MDPTRSSSYNRPLPPVPVDPELDPLASTMDPAERQFELDLAAATRLSLETSAREEEDRKLWRDLDNSKPIVRKQLSEIGPMSSSSAIHPPPPPRPTSLHQKMVPMRRSTLPANHSSAQEDVYTAVRSRPRPPMESRSNSSRGILLPPPAYITGAGGINNNNNNNGGVAKAVSPEVKALGNGSFEDLMCFKGSNDAMKNTLSGLYAQSPLTPLPRTVFPSASPTPLQQQQHLQPPPPLGFVPRQSSYNQTVTVPTAGAGATGFRLNNNNNNISGFAQQQPSNYFPDSNFNSLFEQQHSTQHLNQGIVKSQSWTDGGGGNGSSSHLPPTTTTPSSDLGPAWQSQLKGSQSDFSLKRREDLIDFSADLATAKKREAENKLTKVTVLEAFDPYRKGLEEEDFDLEGKEVDADDESTYYPSALSDSSFYETYDPFEYLSAQSSVPPEGQDPCEEEQEETEVSPVRQQQIKKHTRQPSFPEAADKQTVERRQRQKHEYEKSLFRQQQLGRRISEGGGVANSLNKEKDVPVDSEIRAFTKMVGEIRAKFRHDDPISNAGFVTSSLITSSYPVNTSVKLFVHSKMRETPFIFTCDVTSLVEHITLEVSCNLDGAGGGGGTSAGQYFLQVAGTSEYLDPKSQLKDYEYVHQCYKYDRDLEFILVPEEELQKPYLRTEEDDRQDLLVKVEDISPKDHVKTLSYHELKILLETLESEADRIKSSLTSSPEMLSPLVPNQLVQSVKAICAFLGQIETLEVQDVCDQLIRHCLELVTTKDMSTEQQTYDIKLGDRYSTLTLSSNVSLSSRRKKEQAEQIEQIGATIERVMEVVQKLIEVYAKTFRVNFSFLIPADHVAAAPKESISIQETLLLRVCALHRLKPTWSFDSYLVTMQIYHGTRPVADAMTTEFAGKSESFYERVKFDTWMELKTVRISSLPREARLVFTLTGRKIDHSNKDKPKVTRTELGWGSLQLFNFEKFLAQGTFLLSLWPRQTEKQIGPAPDSGSHPRASTCPVLSIELPEMNANVVFPDKVPIQPPPNPKEYNFKDLLFETQQQLLDICDQDIFTFMELAASEREILWEKRFYLRNVPGALPKVLLAANSWEYASLPSLYGLLHAWKRPKPMDILQLFLPIFPDSQVRQCAMEWLSDIGSDELVDYLPQLLESLKHETWSVSPLAQLLLERSLQSPRVAHSLYWLLKQSLPGMTPQNTQEEEQSSSSRVHRYKRRLVMLMRALYTIGGTEMRNSFCKQQELLKYLYEAAEQVKNSPDTARNALLRRHMESLGRHLGDNATAIPLSPSFIASGVEVKSCSYYTSKAVPLKVVFSASGNETSSSDVGGGPTTAIPVIYKIGDDLRQDMLTMQMIRVMDKMWLSEGLDLKMVTFTCVPTGDKQGMMEMVTEAKTLREIQVTSGVTGSFKDNSISAWLEKHNTSQLEYTRAVQNFTSSCAGYSIATYLLGICDRHNDNIMIKQSGHMFHIDFGKFLGDAERFGNFKRDRSPFVLSPDMAFVINGGKNKPGEKFHEFVDLCCAAFNVVRRNGHLLLNLFALMASSGIPHVTMDAVRYVQRALLPDLSPTEAAATFSRMIEESLGSWFVQWNFFIHNLGQIKFGNDNGGGGGGELLSFIPKRFSLSSDGRIIAVQVFDIQKRYTPERHYVFILRVSREGITDPNFLFRTYKEFCELDYKLSTDFTHSDHCPSLRKSGFNLGRQEVWEVAQRRKHDIARFLESLFQCPESLAHSDLVYTFFHPLLRDQEEANIHLRKLKEQKRRSSNGKIKGELQLSLEYRKNALYVMVCHARDLALPNHSSNQEPNSYVKVYLHPDPQKVTKRKTKVVRKNCFPSFMEMLEYRMALENVRCRTLQATVWDSDRFQENLFLGAVTIPLEELDLAKQSTKWYKLTNFSRMS